MQFLNPESKLMRHFASLGDMMLLNICWLAFSLPVITIGASTTALYAALFSMLARKDKSPVNEFIKGFKESFRQASFLWIIQLIASLLLLASISISLRYFERSSVVFGAMLWISTASLALLTALCSLVYPQIARYSNSSANILRNALILLPMKAILSIVNIVIFSVPIILFVFWRGIFLLTGFVWPLVGFSALFYLSAFIMRKILLPLEPVDSTVKGPEVWT